MNKKYRFLLWDIDGTLLDFEASQAYAIRTLFAKYGFGLCTDGMVERYSAINKRYWKALERNEMTRPEILVGRFREFFTLEGLNAQAAEEFNRDYQLTLGDCIIFTAHAREVLAACRGRYRLIAVTNGTWTAQEKKLRNSGLDQVFDGIYISEKVGCEKPGRGFFDAVFAAEEIADAKEALIIGDSLTSDMQGGVNCGIDTCWYNPSQAENTQSLPLTYEIADLSELAAVLELTL